MAYLKPQTPLKDLNSGDYFYPLTTIDLIITGTSRLSAFMSEDNNLLNLSNIKSINTNNILATYITLGNSALNTDYYLFVNGWSRINHLDVIRITARHLDAAKDTINTDHELYIGYGSNTYTKKTRFYYSTGTDGTDTTDSRTLFAEINANGLYALTRFGVNGLNTSYNLYVNGTSYFNGNATFNGNISFTNSGTGFRGINYGTMGDNDYWRIGGAATGSNAGYMEIATADDGNEPIYIRLYSGVFTTLTRTATLLDGSGNTSFPGRIFADSYSTSSGYINGKATNGGINQILIGDDAWLGDCDIGGTLGIKSYNGSEAGISFYGNDGSGKGRIYYNGTGHSTVGLYGAVWNDYAEFRKSDTQEPGYVIAPAEDGIAYKTSVRMQAGARIISDTFGFAVGECDDAKTPVGLVGRVLAYTYLKRSNYKIGDAVCAAPNGTIDIMTREEIQKYPDRIIGIVNEIPDYEIWKSILTHSNGEQTIKEIEVKDRIWIDIK